MAVTKQSDGGGGTKTTKSSWYDEYQRRLQSQQRASEAARKAAYSRYQDWLKQSRERTAQAQGAQRAAQNRGRAETAQRRGAVTGSLGRTGTMGAQNERVPFWEQMRDQFAKFSDTSGQSMYNTWAVPSNRYPSFIPPIAAPAPGTVRPDYQNPNMGYYRNMVDYQNWMKIMSTDPSQWKALSPTPVNVATPAPGTIPSTTTIPQPEPEEMPYPNYGYGGYPYPMMFGGGGGFNINYPKSEDINRWYANMVNWRIGRPQGG